MSLATSSNLLPPFEAQARIVRVLEEERRGLLLALEFLPVDLSPHATLFHRPATGWPRDRFKPNLVGKVKTSRSKREVATNTDGFADKLDAVLLLVVNANQVKSILFGENGLAKLKAGTAVMVSSTISAQDAPRNL